MGKLKRRIEAKIDRRHRGYAQALEILAKKGGGYNHQITRPGSRNPKKQG